MRLIEARMIWDRAPHNAFTDLVRFDGRWLCTFREGETHISPDGALRVIASSDGENWDSLALLRAQDADLRDPKLTVSPDGQLQLSAAGAWHDKALHTHQSWVWFSQDGRAWSERQRIGDPDFWLWRITWHEDRAYAIGYSCSADPSIRLYCSDDGRQFVPLVSRLFDIGRPSETAIVFSGDTAHCLLRRDGNPSTGLLGSSEPPYTQWRWQDLGVRVGGPHMLALADGRMVAAVRLYDGAIRTSLCTLEPGRGRLTEVLQLPSGGDTSYAGLSLSDGLLSVSYYSSHEGKPAIYFAKVAIDD